MRPTAGPLVPVAGLGGATLVIADTAGRDVAPTPAPYATAGTPGRSRGGAMLARPISYEILG